ncbi:MAG TPA: glycerophosphodiester phosphodiesterase [Burkholderiaceae bacterium]|nr:glycerophosphodiester phosphodiesterase [Burkholderiaceae bacterium]
MTAPIPWPYPRVLAHRGGGTLAPENTLAAIRVGFEHGFTAIECDAMLAADRVPVLIHDPVLERTTSGRGEVAAAGSAEMAALDAGSWFAPRFAGEPVPTLAAAMDLCASMRIWMNIEIKPSPGREAETGAVVAGDVARRWRDGGAEPDASSRAARAGLARAGAPLLSSFSTAALAAARRAAPRLPLGWLCEAPPDDWLARIRDLDVEALHCWHGALDERLARDVREAGYWLFCYTVNDAQRAAQLFAWGIDALCTDRLDVVRPVDPRR